ncbi:MAG: hypothetical protein RR812_03980 [Vagococcus sp.]
MSNANGAMSIEKQATLILEGLDKYIQVDWNMSEFYLKGIIEGLREVQKNKNEGEQEK